VNDSKSYVWFVKLRDDVKKAKIVETPTIFVERELQG